ncbi:MAG: ribosomal silencing factor RsfS [Candidatus Binatia bacterium]|nr:MAG: ribosomal silencing factor RsfS [Candidatus Binatia bacterium]
MKKLSARNAAFVCAKAALDKKAYDLVLLDVSELTSLADYFLICSGRSDTQVQAIAQAVEEAMYRAGHKPLAIEGYRHGHWVVEDFGDVVVHIFFEPVREFYDLERLWAKAPRVSLPEPYETQARESRLIAGSER